MALMHVNCHSDVLGVAVNIDVIIPQKSHSLIGMNTEGDENCKTLYLLHGLSDDQTIWQRRTSIERYAAEKGIAVVMPAVQKSWYTDMAYGDAYFTYITQELPAICRSFFCCISDKREDNYVAGLSMGGYGALKCALTYPEKYAGAASLSGAVDICRYFNGKTEQELPYWYSIFGKFSDVPTSGNDLFHLAEVFSQKNAPTPKLFMWCGTEDTLIAPNRRLKETLDKYNIPVSYSESEGDHSWLWWDKHIRDVLDFMF